MLSVLSDEGGWAYVSGMSTDRSSYLNVGKRCIAVRTAMTARAISRHYDNALREAGLTGTQFSLLVAIGSGDFPSMSALGERLSIDRSTLSRNFKPLLENGWVVKEPGQGGRAIPLRLSDAGAEKLNAALPKWEAAQDKLEEMLSDDELQDGKRFLRALRQAAEAD